jgi:hypothetical protein
MYLVKAYSIGQTFPSWNDNHKTLKQAIYTANNYFKDGFYLIEIYKDNPKKIGYFGIERDLIQTLTI